ncbi:MAG: aminoglycoside phosphotransferase family protein [candidate division KSB1 bacterium]|nr:aminoglycoside phosphotransferase family protein [candidate division KSB1 bacterium]MDZ7302405.1 aminoglycoside phosphotransferase family protein [candidate division KSB1 bacterium]MDZ7311607.1 aminoglycoside phosphotransferase family protein [candidate division KSB1 bacterium]
MASASSELMFHDKLYTLDIALDSQRMRQTFNALAREHFGEHVEVRHLSIEMLRRRNQRCVIRYFVDVFDPVAQWQKEWRIIGKVYKANRGERVFELMQELWEKGFSRQAADHISIPEPLDFSSSLCMLFQEEVPGLPVKTWLKQSPEPEYLRQLARTLVKLHRCPLIPGKPFRMKDHLSRCHPSHHFLSLACPEQSKKIDYIVNAAYKIESTFDESSFTPVHGDFHLGQVHLLNGNAWLIDFDALSYGDPASDLGNVLVFLRGKARKIPQISELITAFLDEYFSVMDREIAARISLYEGLTHLRRACKCLRLQEEGWERKVRRMIDLGVSCLENMEKSDWQALSRSYEVAEDEDWEELEVVEGD